MHAGYIFDTSCEHSKTCAFPHFPSRKFCVDFKMQASDWLSQQTSPTKRCDRLATNVEPTNVERFWCVRQCKSEMRASR